MKGLRSRGRRRIIVSRLPSLALVLVISQTYASVATAQPSSPAQVAPRTAPAFSLAVTSRDGATEIALKAEDALLSEVAADLGKRLRANVTLGPSLRQERVTVDFVASPLEPVLTSLAGRALVDYDIRQDGRSIPRDIYLLGADDPAPLSNTTERGVSVGLMISGNTEDVAPAPADDPLLITGDRHLMSIQVKKQPLPAVVVAVADVLGVPVDIRYDASELVDLDLRNVAPEDVLPRLSRNLHMIVRVNLATAERTLNRIVVDRPPDPR